MLWQALRTNHLHGYHFRRQQVIAGFIADFYCHAAGLIVEVDGGVHTQQQEYDAERDQVLAAHGLRIMRFSNDEVRRNLSVVLARIAAACREGVQLVTDVLPIGDPSRSSAPSLRGKGVGG
jgi:very-short-patch-repair endonuclease